MGQVEFMNGNILLIIGIGIPLLIKSIKGNSDNDHFKLADFSKILSLGLVYYAIASVGYGYMKIDLFNFNFHIGLQVTMALATILLVLHFSFQRQAIVQQLYFPRIERKSKLYLMTVFFFCLSALSELLAIELFQNDIVKFGLSNAVAYKAVSDSPFFAVPALLLAEIACVANEELLFRYFAFNALKQKLSGGAVVVVSAAIWTLVHPMLSPYIFAVGLILGYLYSKTGSLALCMTLHFLTNLISSTGIFYVAYAKMSLIAIPLVQYVLCLFIIQLAIYHLIEILAFRLQRLKD